MKKLNKEKHRKKMARLRRKMLKALVENKNKKAQKLRQKIIRKILENKEN